jgi:hypothetical protein
MKFLSFPIGRRCRPQIPHKNAASQTIYDEGSEEDMQIERRKKLNTECAEEERRGHGDIAITLIA